KAAIAKIPPRPFKDRAAFERTAAFWAKDRALKSLIFYKGRKGRAWKWLEVRTWSGHEKPQPGCCAAQAEAPNPSVVQLGLRRRAICQLGGKQTRRVPVFGAGGHLRVAAMRYGASRFSSQPHAHGGTSHTNTRCHPHGVHAHSQQLGKSANTPKNATSTN